MYYTCMLFLSLCLLCVLLFILYVCEFLNILLQDMYSIVIYSMSDYKGLCAYINIFRYYIKTMSYTVSECIQSSVLYNNIICILQKDNHPYEYVFIHFYVCVCIFFGGTVYMMTLPASPPLWGLRQSCMCFLCVYVCVCVCLCVSVCVCTQTSRSAEVRLVMALLCLVGTAATVTFTNAMNQRQRGQAGRPKNNQLYSSQIDTGWTGQRERWRRTEHTPRTNKQKRMRAQTDRGPSGLEHRYGGFDGPILFHQWL